MEEPKFYYRAKLQRRYNMNGKAKATRFQLRHKKVERKRI